MMRDRSDDDALPITQNLLAEMLGVQRPTITNAARELERQGLIKRTRRLANGGWKKAEKGRMPSEQEPQQPVKP